MARRGAPALYELMRRPGSPGAASGTDPGPAPTRRSGRAPSLPATFELGVGTVAVIAVAVAVAIAVAYGIGLQRGRSLAGAPGASTEQAPSGAQERTAATPAPSAGPRIPSLGERAPAAARRTEAAATDNNGDPRVKGSRYFVLAHPSSQRAAEMVEFCRLNGLDAHLVPDDNALLRKIIVLPGYRDASEKSSPEIKQLEAKIRSVGESWKSKARGNKDFADAYPELYR